MRLNQAMAAHEALISLGYEAIGLDHYAVPADSLAVATRARVLRRNFQGYTTDDASALIGIGASAIGRLPQGYVQNASDTANYSRAITAGHFATVRGIALSTEDRIRSRIIEELMCHLDCDIGELLDEYNGIPESFEHELDALQPFVADGFVRMNDNRIIVEERGRPYLRLIASTFDAYLPNSHVRHSVAV
jgi:oxygen-independent coproporphyrinogen-3 oxidase